MTKSCFISIIIPVFNEEDCIEKTLDRSLFRRKL
jgi:glycosyltransferase involved in cell wall biosynthesis